ncbi:MAG: hypothetical protein ACYCZF_00025 [Anaerolineae bacterium]
MVTISTDAVDGSAIHAIPYFAWDNRTAAEAKQDWLMVWLRQERFRIRQLLDSDDHHNTIMIPSLDLNSCDGHGIFLELQATRTGCLQP